MQSRVEAFGVFLSHSITNLSSSSPTGAPADDGIALRFLCGLGMPLLAPFGVVELPPSSVALRLTPAPFGFATEVLAPPTGLVARLPDVGLPARLPPARGLFPRLTPLAGFGFGIFGLVARFATTE